MAAAVADFRPKHTSGDKIKKQDGIPQIELEAAPDVLLVVASSSSGKQRPRLVVGFAAENRDLLVNASEKLKSKNLDMIVANDISAPDAGFAVDTNRATFLYADGRTESLPLMSKAEVAETLIARIAAMLEKK
jgi:phosphopantothenoylcysteine decarboxylase/phosphopantothenate--cysteine ligase